MMARRPAFLGFLGFASAAMAQDAPRDLYRYQEGEPRWVSPENPTGAKGAGAREN